MCRFCGYPVLGDAATAQGYRHFTAYGMLEYRLNHLQASETGVLPLIFVSSIDEEPVPMPTTKTQVEALIAQLDEAGIAAVMEGVQQHYGQTDEAKQRESIKK